MPTGSSLMSQRPVEPRDKGGGCNQVQPPPPFLRVSHGEVGRLSRLSSSRAAAAVVSAFNWSRSPAVSASAYST